MTTETMFDPALCEKDHEIWVKEIATWKAEHRRALNTLEETMAFIRAHDAELDEHLDSVGTHRQAAAQGRAPDEAMRERHLEVKERHNRFRGRHAGLIKEVLQLQVALHKAAHSHIL